MAAAKKKPQADDADSFKGFGAQPKPRPAAPLKFEEEEAAEEQFDEGEGEEFRPQPEYRMYTDAGFAASRSVSQSVTLARHAGHPTPVLTAAADLQPGELLLVVPSLGLVEGAFQEAPEVEDLHVAMLEGGLTPAQRRVLDLVDGLTALPAAAAASSGGHAGAPAGAGAAAAAALQQQLPLPSLATLDVKFWASRGRRDSAAPEFGAKRLRQLLGRCAISDTERDAAVTQARHERPSGFAGLWPEFSLLGHSCAPNTSLLVVGDRLFVHAVNDVPKGTPLTRNYLGASVFAPLSVRHEELAELRGGGEAAAGGAPACSCPRCTLEARVSEGLRETLDGAHEWLQTEARATWNAANEGEDEVLLQGLLEETEIIVSEVEAAVDAEPGLEDEEREWLRASVYDVYDLLVVVDELLNKNQADATYLRLCLDIISSTTPGAENHVQVALKNLVLQQTIIDAYQGLLSRERSGQGGKTRKQKATLQALAKGVLNAKDNMLDAMLVRYGWQDDRTYTQLTEALQAYVDGMEQMSAMAAQGVTELTREMEVDGVNVQIVDRMGISAAPGGEGGEGDEDGEDGGSQRTVRSVMQDGIQLSFIDDYVGGGAGTSASGRQGSSAGGTTAAAAQARLAPPAAGGASGSDDDGFMEDFDLGDVGAGEAGAGGVWEEVTLYGEEAEAVAAALQAQGGGGLASHAIVAEQQDEGGDEDDDLLQDIMDIEGALGGPGEQPPAQPPAASQLQPPQQQRREAGAVAGAGGGAKAGRR